MRKESSLKQTKRNEAILWEYQNTDLTIYELGEKYKLSGSRIFAIIKSEYPRKEKA